MLKKGHSSSTEVVVDMLPYTLLVEPHKDGVTGCGGWWWSRGDGRGGYEAVGSEGLETGEGDDGRDVERGRREGEASRRRVVDGVDPDSAPPPYTPFAQDNV